VKANSNIKSMIVSMTGKMGVDQLESHIMYLEVQHADGMVGPFSRD
jgi:hypothetical protein